MPTFKDLYPQFYTDSYDNSGLELPNPSPDRPMDPNPDVSPISQYSAFATMGRPNPRMGNLFEAPQPSGGNFSQRFHAVLAGQNPYDVQSMIETRKAQREEVKARQAAVDAQTEATLFDKIQAAPPGERDPYVKALTRWYDTKGVKPDKGFVDTWKNADAAALELYKQAGQEYIKQQAIDNKWTPEQIEEKTKAMLASPVAFAHIHAEAMKLSKLQAETKKLESEAEFLKTLPEATKALSGGNEPPGSPTSPPMSSPSAIPRPGPSTQPGLSQGPQTGPRVVGKLSSGRPIVQNPDGSVSTHRNIIVNFDKDFYVIPTIFGGRQVSEDEAVDIIKKNGFIDPDTGQKLPRYNSQKEAQVAEAQGHIALEQETAPYTRGSLKQASTYPEYLLTPEGQKVQQFVVNKAKALGIDPAYAQALIHQESRWDPQAKSPTGVQGLAQVTQATGSRYGQDPAMRTNPMVSANAGLTHFADLLKETGGSYPEALRRYNGGSDPQYVQNVERHLPLYGGRPVTRATTQGPPEYQQRIAELNTQIAQQGQRLRQSLAMNMNTHGKAIWEAAVDRQKADIQERDSLLKQHDPKAADPSVLAATALGISPNPAQWTPPQAEAVKGLVTRWEVEKAQQIEEATRPGKLELVEAGREGQTIKDVTEFEDEKGNNPPTGSTYGDLKKAGGKYKQVKPMPEKQFEENQNRRDVINSFQELAKTYTSITTGPMAGRIERWKQALGGDVKDDQVGTRLLLQKIKNDISFLRGGKALTIPEATRIEAELPADTDPPRVFREKLDKALSIARRIHKDHLADAKGFKIPESFHIPEPETEGNTPPASTVSPALQAIDDFLNKRKK